MSFNQLGLSEQIMRGIAGAGFSQATAVQSQAIPALLARTDVLACAPTGTGKSAAFLLPLLQRLSEHGSRGRSRQPRALVLSPTRELAMQIHETALTLGRFTRVRSAVVYGGVSSNRQIQSLSSGCDLLIATPGRLLDLLGQGRLSLHEVESLVLDEADRMLDMGFVRDVERIVAQTARKRNTSLFSATLAPPIRKLAHSMLVEPREIHVGPVGQAAVTVDQWLFSVERSGKFGLLCKLLHSGGSSAKFLVFARTKRGAEKLSKRLQRTGVPAGAIHGNKSQSARTRILSEFRGGKIRVLIASDVAARGIDVTDISHVINFDVPDEPDTYVHRIGRTGRAGATGIALTLCCDDLDRERVRNIERRLRARIQVVEEVGQERRSA